MHRSKAPGLTAGKFYDAELALVLSFASALVIAGKRSSKSVYRTITAWTATILYIHECQMNADFKMHSLALGYSLSGVREKTFYAMTEHRKELKMQGKNIALGLGLTVVMYSTLTMVTILTSLM